MKLRTRLALLLAALAGVTATLVGVAGHRLTSVSFRNEIKSSLNSSAARLARASGLEAARACSNRFERHGRLGLPASPGQGSSGSGGGSGGDSGGGPRPSIEGPGVEDGGVDDLRADQPVAIVVQCLDSSGQITFAPRPFDLPINDEERKLISAPRGTKITRTVTINDQKYLQMTVAVEPSGAVQLARQLSENDNVLSSLIWRFGLLVAGSTALAGIAGLWVARRTTRPIDDLALAAEEIAANGHLDVVLPNPRGNDETGRLTRSFATMVDALKTSKSQQTQLVHDAGHELRTPITSLRTNIGVLRRHRDLPAETQIRLVDDMHAELAELTGLVDELIALAADNESDDPFGPVDLADVVTNTVNRWSRRSGRTISLDIENGAVFPLEGRERMLGRAVSNLVSNATKFSPEGSPVMVTLRRAWNSYELVVRDNGPGIVDEDLPKIFDRFYRSTIHRDHPGSGLGLSIVSSAAAAHGGKVSVQNNSDGPGARFTLSLPSDASGSSQP